MSTIGVPGMVGKNERDTILRQLSWLSNWGCALTRTIRTVVASIRASSNTLSGNDKKDKITLADTQARVDSAIIALNAAADSVDKTYASGDILDVIDSQCEMCAAECVGQVRIPTEQPVEQKASAPVTPHDQGMFLQTVNELFRQRDVLQKIYSTYYRDVGPVVQLQIKILSNNGDELITPELDIIPIFEAYVRAAVQKKIEAGEAIGLDAKVEEPAALPQPEAQSEVKEDNNTEEK